MMNRVRVCNLYSGRVQGVGFRITVKSLTAGFEVVGTIRNLPDGRVELVAEGLRPELEALLVGIRESEVGGFIKQEAPIWLEARNDLKGFAIIG